jgi:hypothetical protein
MKHYEYSLSEKKSLAMQIQHIIELFALDGDTFVTEGYRNLLGRDPDEHGLRYYLGRLALGYGKPSVIVQLAKSPECRPHNEVIGLKAFIAEERRAGHWLWGKLSPNRQMTKSLQSGIAGLGQIDQQLTALHGAMNILNLCMANITEQQENLVHQMSEMTSRITNSLQQTAASHNTAGPSTMEVSNIGRATACQEFQNILGREPEGENAIAHHAQWHNAQALRESLMSTDEHKNKLTDMTEHARGIFTRIIAQQQYNLGD